MSLIAIGDIHGQLDALKTLVNMLPKDSKLVFLGDYCDRGLESYGVIEYLIELGKTRDCVFLKGNHDDFLLGAINGNNSDACTLMYNGGDETNKSYKRVNNLYGIDYIPPSGWESARWSKFKAPEHHKVFLESLEPFYETDNFFFVHAGVDPLKPKLSDTEEYEMLWIRYEFLLSEKTYAKMVVHGHSPVYPGYEIEIKHNRINVDTGAGYFKKLTAIDVETHKTWEVQC